MSGYVLIACEESQITCTAFRKLGVQAYSCDIQEPSGGHPEWHIQTDVLSVIDGCCSFVTLDGALHHLHSSWDLVVAHPPCTYLTKAAAQCHSLKVYSDDIIAARTFKSIAAAEFFMNCYTCMCSHVLVENPIGIMNSMFRKPDQIIQPFEFGDSPDDLHSKTTCFWLRGLPPLVRQFYEPPIPGQLGFYGVSLSASFHDNWVENTHGAKARSKTFRGVAAAIAQQYSQYLGWL